MGCDRSILFHHDRFEFNDGARPAHDFDLGKRLSRYQVGDKVVYLERDPRDVMVSLFHQVTGRFRDFFGYSGTISDFIRDDYFGAHCLRRFREMWTVVSLEAGFLKITYEQCHHSLEDTLRRVLDYYEIDVSERAFNDAIAASAFSNMKAIEDTNSYPKPWLRKRQDFPKMRKGVVGGYRQELTPSDVAYLDAVFGKDIAGLSE
jgi:hypothetical protein